jgi:hypothetical protein
MRIYTVHEAPSNEGGLESATLIPESFSFGAFLFGPFWLLAEGAWRSALLLLFALVGLLVLARLAGFDEGALAAALVGYALWCGASGHDWRRAALKRRGYGFMGVIAAPSQDEAELRYFRGMGA